MLEILDVLIDTLIDAVKILPFLFIAYLVIEILEKKAGDKTIKFIKKSGKFGPILGSLLGVVPQCGFSAAASNLFAGRIITMGTLISIFLSTSDEMLPVLITAQIPSMEIIKILLIKILVGIIAGTAVDLIFRKKSEENINEQIHELCHDEHCHCEEEGIIKSSIKHTLHILVYILLITLILNMAIFFIGEERIASLATGTPVIGIIISCLIGVIPNCASSVIITQLYIDEILSIGAMISGLLVNSGIGILILFKVNKNKKENFKILGILYIVAIISGIIIDLVI